MVSLKLESLNILPSFSLFDLLLAFLVHQAVQTDTLNMKIVKQNGNKLGPYPL